MWLAGTRLASNIESIRVLDAWMGKLAVSAVIFSV